MTGARRPRSPGHGDGAGRRLGAAVAGCCLLLAAGAIARAETPAEGPPPVEILRGSVAPPPPPIEPGVGPDRAMVIAGERVWFVDETGGRLTGCRLINTIRVGVQAIRCTERPLPRGYPVGDAGRTR